MRTNKGGNQMRIKEAAQRLGISAETIRKWEREGMIVSQRSVLGQRIFDERSLTELQQIIQQKSDKGDNSGN